MKKTSLRAFTLIEIMIVVVIIGILAVALFPKLLGAIGKTNDEARKSEMKNLTAILLQYKNDHQGSFIDSAGSPITSQCLSPSSQFGTILVNQGYVTAAKFPKDPNKGTPVGACTGTNSGYFDLQILTAFGVPNNAYALTAKVENQVKGNSAIVGFAGEAQTFTPGTCVSTSTCGFYVEVGGF